MKDLDFEKAIENLGGSIVVDEMKIYKGQVRQVHGHNQNMRLVWDENGRAYSAPINRQAEKYLYPDKATGKVGLDVGTPMDRDKIFDLTF